MNDSLATALHSYRFWRDIGADVLIGALLAEFLIEAWWPEHPEKKHIRLSRRQAMTIAAFVVFAGVAIERIWGTWADDAGDQIRTNLQMKLIRVAPRAELLYGESRKELVARLRQPRFAGQKVETRFCGVSFNRSSIDEDTVAFAMLLPSVLQQAGWAADFADRLEGCNGTGVWVMVSHKAPKSTREAADAVCSALAALPVVVNPKSQELSAGEPEPRDVHAVTILVEAHPI